MCDSGSMNFSQWTVIYPKISIEGKSNSHDVSIEINISVADKRSAPCLLLPVHTFFNSTGHVCFRGPMPCLICFSFSYSCCGSFLCVAPKKNSRCSCTDSPFYLLISFLFRHDKLHCNRCMSPDCWSMLIWLYMLGTSTWVLGGTINGWTLCVDVCVCVFVWFVPYSDNDSERLLRMYLSPSVHDWSASKTG